MDGLQSIIEEPTSLDWPTTEDTFIDPPAAEREPATDGAGEPEEQSDENLWSRSRDFDWGD